LFVEEVKSEKGKERTIIPYLWEGWKGTAHAMLSFDEIGYVDL
jgi:hypothetical protein